MLHIGQAHIGLVVTGLFCGARAVIEEGPAERRQVAESVNKPAMLVNWLVKSKAYVFTVESTVCVAILLPASYRRSRLGLQRFAAATGRYVK
jgi:hypothetical protein